MALTRRTKGLGETIQSTRRGTLGLETDLFFSPLPTGFSSPRVRLKLKADKIVQRLLAFLIKLALHY
jgi:hypothetical protein